MATCSDLIKGAFRRAGITGDVDEIRPREMDRGLQVLGDLYMSMVADGLFGRQNDVEKAEDYAAEEQDRILCTTEDDITITLPETVEDDTVDGGTRPPRDGAIITVSDLYSADNVAFVYDASYAAWTNLASLTLTSFAPLSVRYRAALEAKLAVLLAEENGAPVTSTLRRAAFAGTMALSHRFDGPARAPVNPSYF